MSRCGRRYMRQDVTYVLTWNDIIPHSRVPFPGIVIMVVYAINLLEYCHSKETLMHTPFSNINTTLTPPALTSDTIDQSTTIKLNHGRQDSPSKTDKAQSGDDSKLNDVIHKLGLRPKTTQMTTSSTEQYTTERPLVSTRRAIYIRGHLLRPPSSRKTSTFHPPEAADKGLFKAPNSGHLHRVHDFRDSGKDNEGSRKKRKQKEEKERFHNYKLLYGASQIDENSSEKKTEFYAWIFGAAMLAVVSLTTVISCVVFCFCSDRNKQKKKKRAPAPRRPHDTAGEYQRVESVSSIVDHAGENLDTIYEEQIDSVTII